MRTIPLGKSMDPRIPRTHYLFMARTMHWNLIAKDPFSLMTATARNALIQAANQKLPLPEEPCTEEPHDRLALRLTLPEKASIGQMFHFGNMVIPVRERGAYLQAMVNQVLGPFAGPVPPWWTPPPRRVCLSPRELRVLVPDELIRDMYRECRSRGMMASDLLDEILLKYADNPPVYEGGLRRMKAKGLRLYYRPSERVATAMAKVFDSSSGSAYASLSVRYVDMIAAYFREGRTPDPQASADTDRLRRIEDDYSVVGDSLGEGEKKKAVIGTEADL